MTCQFCKEEFKSLGGLHGHVKKKHGCDQKEYYHMFFPRYDLHTSELINYKTFQQYHETDFNSRESFAQWLSENRDDPKVKEYAIQKLKERMTKKMVTTLPSQVELKSIFLPSISGFEKIYGNLDKFIKEMALRNIRLKFDYSLTPNELRDTPYKIYMDTREQRPLHFDQEVVKMKLSCGDYTCSEPYFANVFIERKSLMDLAGTLGHGRDRFQEEIQRAKDLGFYLIVVVEDSHTNAMHYSPSNAFSKKMTGAHIFHEIREIMTEFDNIQFVFTGSRSRAAEIIDTIFKLGESVKKMDLEFLKDKKII